MSRTSTALTDLCQRLWGLPRVVVPERAPGRVDNAAVAAVVAGVVVAVVVGRVDRARGIADLGSAS